MFIHLLHLGRVGYAEGLEIQARVIAARKQGAIGDTLLLLEHPAVITLGRNSSRANVLASDEWLAARNVELHEINRGGDVTYHGPGQLVGYPIFDLRGEWPGKRGPFLGPVDFVRMMEEALIRVCADFGVMAKRIAKCTGVWTFGGGETSEDACGAIPAKRSLDGAPSSSSHISGSRCGAPDSVQGAEHAIREKKLAAIGVHVSQGVTSHGFALNVTTDLREFEWIVPCGISDRGVTSLELEAPAGTAVTMEAAMHSAARSFGRVFGRQMVWCESLEQLLAPA
ncbi:MAG TPA: lipoyl(octanoyl) transferase [Acidobacteriaceae bacterium]|nr:lipoyl(octanoyl) transferase [Acidobacteriaceae bacterium]